MHDLTFPVSSSARSVNADTDFEKASPVALGRVLRDIIGRIWYLRRQFGPRARIVLSKIDVTEAFRQVIFVVLRNMTEMIHFILGSSIYR